MKNRIPPAALGVSGWFLAGARQIACLKMGHKCWGLFDDKCDMGNLMIVDGDLNITTSDSGGKWMQGALRFQVLESPTWGCIQLGKWVNKTPLTYYIWYMIVYDCIWIYIYIYMEYHHVYMGFSGLWKVLKPPWPRCDAWISPELLCLWEAPRLSWAVRSVNLTVEAGGSESASQQAVLNKNGWTSDENFGALPLQGWMKPCLGMFWGAATPKNRTDAGRTAQYIAESTCLWCKRAVFVVMWG